MPSDRTYMPRKKNRRKRALIDARGIIQPKSREIGALGDPGRFRTYGQTGNAISKIHFFA